MTSPIWLTVELAYFAIVAGLFALAFRSKSQWTKASVGALAVSILAWRTLAVVPSWWLYFAEGDLRWGGQGCTTLNLWGDEITRTAAIQCLKQAGKDTVVVIQNAAVLGAFVVGFLQFQKRFPKQLAPGESKPEATGGYR